MSIKTGRARANDCAGRGEETEGSGDDGVTGLDSAACDREPQGIGPGSTRDGVIDSEKRGDLTLKGLDFLAQNKVLRRAHAFHRGQNLIANRGVLTSQIEHGDAGQDAGR